MTTPKGLSGPQSRAARESSCLLCVEKPQLITAVAFLKNQREVQTPRPDCAAFLSTSQYLILQ